MKKVSIMIPCYNEEENVVPISEAVVAQMEQLPQYDYEILFIDNDSQDNTRPLLREICTKNPKIRAIFNSKNFGQFNSPYYGLCRTSGDCTISLCCDFQDPVEMIPLLLAEWEKGYRIVCAVKTSSKENKLMYALRGVYYRMIRKMSSIEQIEHFTGFGLYDHTFVDVMRGLDDPNPFLRGVIAELGFKKTTVPYEQAKRRAGKTHNNFKTLYDAAMQSFTTYTKTPIRLFMGLGVFFMAASCLGALTCLILHLCDVRMHPQLWLLPIIGIFGSLNLMATSVIGEYLLTMRAQIKKRPLVIEERRINFDQSTNDGSRK
jgi:glycosyltransferase involved in cell wall biosynthesis